METQFSSLTLSITPHLRRFFPEFACAKSRGQSWAKPRTELSLSASNQSHANSHLYMARRWPFEPEIHDALQSAHPIADHTLSAGNMRGFKHWQAITLGLMLAVRLSATVVVQPTFGHPLVYADRIIFTSVDGKGLIAIDKEGQQRWAIRFPEAISLNRWSDKAVLVQNGEQVFQVDIEHGIQSKMVAMAKYQYLSVDEGDHTFAVAVDLRFDHHRIQILDPANYTPIWESSTIERILQVTPTMIVAVTATRVIGTHDSYQLKDAAVRGYDRSNGSISWSIPLSDADLVTSAVSEHFLVVVQRLKVIDGDDGSEQLLALNPDTGAILSRLRGEFSDLSTKGDSLTVLESASTRDPGKARLYTCVLPQCTKSPGVLLSAKEILRFQTYGDYVLTWGIYDAACFSLATGKRLSGGEGSSTGLSPLENRYSGRLFPSKFVCQDHLHRSSDRSRIGPL
jgi:hypothetical protein